MWNQLAFIEIGFVAELVVVLRNFKQLKIAFQEESLPHNTIIWNDNFSYATREGESFSHPSSMDSFYSSKSKASSHFHHCKRDDFRWLNFLNSIKRFTFYFHSYPMIGFPSHASSMKLYKEISLSLKIDCFSNMILFILTRPKASMQLHPTATVANRGKILLTSAVECTWNASLKACSCGTFPGKLLKQQQLF